jgi:hypothetical protein
MNYACGGHLTLRHKFEFIIFTFFTFSVYVSRGRAIAQHVQALAQVLVKIFIILGVNFEQN